MSDSDKENESKSSTKPSNKSKIGRTYKSNDSPDRNMKKQLKYHKEVNNKNKQKIKGLIFDINLLKESKQSQDTKIVNLEAMISKLQHIISCGGNVDDMEESDDISINSMTESDNDIHIEMTMDQFTKRVFLLMSKLSTMGDTLEMIIDTLLDKCRSFFECHI